MSLLKSRTFWIFTTASGTIASALGYDRYKKNFIMDQFMTEASKAGEQLTPEDAPDRRISLLLFAPDHDSIQRQKSMFKEYSVRLLTQAGVDYEWVEFDGAALDKRYYELKDELEAEELPDGKMPEVDQKSRPRVFDENSCLSYLMGRWMNSTSDNKDELKDEVLRSLLSVDFGRQSAFTDGLISMNGGTFRSLLHTFSLRKISSTIELNFGMINCEYPSGLLWRLYWMFNTRKLADAIGRETLAVISDRKGRVPLSEVLTSEPVNMTEVNIYRS